MSRFIKREYVNILIDIANLHNIHENKKMAILLSIVVFYSIVCRILKPELLALLFLGIGVISLLSWFYYYVLIQKEKENVNTHTIEYSWGYVKKETSKLDINRFFQYLKTKDFHFFKEFVITNKEYFILFSFIFPDLLVAYKNLDLYNSGLFIAMSLLTKFVFIGYIHLQKVFKRVDLTTDNKDERILDIFYAQLNGMLSVFFVIFVFFFVLSKLLSEIFLGNHFFAVHSSLPFILVSNMSLVLSLFIYDVARRLDSKSSQNILKIFSSILVIVFIFWPIKYIDSITFFIIGAASILSVFLYNFVIKKPSYIENTYNLTF